MAIMGVAWATTSTDRLIANSVLEIGDGYRAKNSELGSIGLPFARAGNIDNGFHFEGSDILDERSVAKAGDKISQLGDSVFTSKGTVGRFAFVRHSTQAFVYSPQLCYWRVKNASVLDPRFLFFWMHGHEFSSQVHQVKGLTDMADYVNLRDQRHMKITLPPLPIQRKIAGILAAYDELIENNTRRITILEEMARGLYYEWFVRFRFPGYEGARMVESALGAIPEGWRVRTLGEICDATGGIVRTGPFGSQLHESDYVSSGTPVVMPKNIVEDRIVTHAIARISDEEINRLSQHVLRTGDIVYGRRGDIGRRALIHRNEDGWLCGTGCIRINLGVNEIMNSSILFHYLGQPDVVARVAGQAIGATLPNLNSSILRGLKVICPTSEIQRKAVPLLGTNEDMAVTLMAANDALRRARDLLLPRLVSGEVDVEARKLELSLNLVADHAPAGQNS